MGNLEEVDDKVVSAGGNTKLLSTYPASQAYINSLGPGFIG